MRSRHQIDTSDVKQGQIPPSISLPPNKKGNFQAALLDAWRLIEVVGDGPAAEFIRLQQKIMLSHLEARNNSIFAHGFKPIASAEWENLYTWMKTSFIPMVKAEAQLCGCKTDLPQLPDRFVW